MRLKVMVLGLVVLVAALAVAWDQRGNIVTTALSEDYPPHARHASGPVAPPATFGTLDGRAVATWDEIDAPRVMVNFWATWCPPCMAEMPMLLQTVGKAKGEVALVAVSVDTEKGVMEQQVALWQAAHPEAKLPTVYWVWDEGLRFSRETFGVKGLPQTVLLGPVMNGERRIVRRIVGEARAEQLSAW